MGPGPQILAAEEPQRRLRRHPQPDSDAFDRWKKQIVWVGAELEETLHPVTSSVLAASSYISSSFLLPAIWLIAPSNLVVMPFVTRPI